MFLREAVRKHWSYKPQDYKRPVGGLLSFTWFLQLRGVLVRPRSLNAFGRLKFSLKFLHFVCLEV